MKAMEVGSGVDTSSKVQLDHLNRLNPDKIRVKPKTSGMRS